MRVNPHFSVSKRSLPHPNLPPKNTPMGNLEKKFEGRFFCGKNYALKLQAITNYFFEIPHAQSGCNLARYNQQYP